VTGGLRDRLRTGPALVGTFLQVPAAATAELVAGLGVDFTCVEAEHSAIGVESVQALVAASALGGAPALVRVRRNAPAEIEAALDAGAAGVLVPRVDSAAEARDAVAAGRYPPRGRRGVGPGRAAGYGAAIERYLAEANDSLVIGVQIESAAAVERASEIVAVPDLDFVFVGPGDLAVSLGVPLGDPAVAEPVGAVLEAARAAGLAAGIWAPTSEAARGWIERGVALVVVGSELGFLAEALARALAEIRSAA
jgi:4-hydroxy-2-oxoheptanedioate aldolase